jgi:hypothetical protein
MYRHPRRDLQPQRLNEFRRSGISRMDDRMQQVRDGLLILVSAAERRTDSTPTKNDRREN